MPRRQKPRAPHSIRLDDEIVLALDQYRRDQAEIPTLPEAVRQILGEWLAHNGYMEPGLMESGHE